MTLAERIRPRSLRRRLLYANLALAILVLLVFAFAAVAVVSLRSASVKAERSTRTTVAATAVEKSVLDLETGARGFALTQRQDFLAPWRTARARLPGELARLRALVRDNTAESGTVDNVDFRIRDYVNAFSIPFVRAVRTGGLSTG